MPRQFLFEVLHLLLLTLQAPELGVQAVVGKQCLVATAFDDATLVHHDDQVCVHDGGQPVRDHQGRPTVGDAVQFGLNGPL